MYRNNNKWRHCQHNLLILEDANMAVIHTMSQRYLLHCKLHNRIANDPIFDIKASILLLFNIFIYLPVFFVSLKKQFLYS